MTPSTALLPRHYCCFLRSPLGPNGSSVRSRSLFHSDSIPSQGRNSSKYEKNSIKFWDQFYKRHHNKFFKDRHYLQKDWGRYFSPNLSSENELHNDDPRVILEAFGKPYGFAVKEYYGEKGHIGVMRKDETTVGCGAGNSLFPILEAFPNAFVHACDFSPRAIELVKAHGSFKNNRVNAFVCDVTMENLCKMIAPASVDVVTMIFMLSAVSPTRMPLVLHNIKNVLKPSGHLLFRDYAIGDFSQEKLARKDQMISKNFYFRESLSSLFKNSGFNTTEVSLYSRQIVNRSQDIAMDRHWVRAVCSVDHPDYH